MEKITKQNDKATDNKGHRERVRNKISLVGFDVLAPYEQIEAFLMGCIVRKDTKPLAKVLAAKYGTFYNFLNASEDSLRSVEGVGDSVIFYIKFQRMIINNYISNVPYHISSENPEKDLEKLIIDRLNHKQTETLLIICMNDRYEILKLTEFESRSQYHNTTSKEEILLEILNVHCSRVVIAHNHPSGVCLPSSDDLDFTKSIETSLDGTSIRLVQHYIVSGGKIYGIM